MMLNEWIALIGGLAISATAVLVAWKVVHHKNRPACPASETPHV